MRIRTYSEEMKYLRRDTMKAVLFIVSGIVLVGFSLFVLVVAPIYLHETVSDSSTMGAMLISLCVSVMVFSVGVVMLKATRERSEWLKGWPEEEQVH